MSIFTRFKDIVNSNINSLLDKAEDPEKMIDQCLRNLNADMSKVKSETAAVMAEEARAKREYEEAAKEVERMQAFAVKALQAGNEEDAKKFLEKKALEQNRVDSLKQTYDVAAANSSKMKEMYAKLQKDIVDLEQRRSMIKGKMAAAKAQERVNNMVSSVKGSADSISAFERMEAKANAALDKANALSELNSAPADSIEDLTAKYGASTTDVDAELAALKASLGQ